MSYTRHLIIASAITLLTTGQAWAATHTVCASGCDYSSIQAAVNAASDGDTLSLSPETFNEGDIDLDIDLTIKTSSGVATVDGAGYLQVFEIDTDAIVFLEDLKLLGGSRARLVNSGITTLKTVQVLGDGTTNSIYGGIVNYASGYLKMQDNSVVAANRSASLGGGINNFGELEVANATLTANQGRLGGALFNSQGDASIANSSISFNHATVRGGGYANANVGGGAVIVHSSSSYSGNTAGSACDTYYDIHRTPGCVN